MLAVLVGVGGAGEGVGVGDGVGVAVGVGVRVGVTLGVGALHPVTSGATPPEMRSWPLGLMSRMISTSPTTSTWEGRAVVVQVQEDGG